MIQGGFRVAPVFCDMCGLTENYLLAYQHPSNSSRGKTDLKQGITV